MRHVGRWPLLAVVVVPLLFSGCSLFSSRQSKADESLRKQAQADPFPNAQQTGLAIHGTK
jgi:hypothetical protein